MLGLRRVGSSHGIGRKLTEDSGLSALLVPDYHDCGWGWESNLGSQDVDGKEVVEGRKIESGRT